MNVYSTTVLNKVIENLKRPSSALLNMFFPMIETSDTEEIKFDVLKGKRRIAPFVSPMREGKLVESLGYSTSTFEPAYVKDKRVFKPDAPLKRTAGEQIGGSITSKDRANVNLMNELTDQTQMLTRRFEVMASEVMRTGKVTVTGDGFDTVVVDFGRDPTHTITLSGASRWGEVGIVPLQNIEDWSLTMLQNSGAQLTDVVMDTKAFRLFIADQQTKDQLDIRRAGPSELELTAMAKLGLSYKGSIGNVSYWVYSDWYVDDTDTEVSMIPDNTVILGSRQMDGVRHFGAIRDEEAGYQGKEFFAKSWTIKDPAHRLLMLQSAPLLVPYRPDASFCVTVA